MKIRKKKRVVGIILAVIIAFVAGFASGAYISEKFYKNKQVVETMADTENEIKTENEENKSGLKEVLAGDVKLSKEEKILKNLSDELSEFMKKKYPDIELSFLIENLDTGAKSVYNAKKMNCASIIKLFVAEHVYKGIEAGAYEHSEKIQDDLYHMIVESNNPAVNRFIDLAGGENEKRKIDDLNKINVTIKERNYFDTELNRKMYDDIPPGGPTGYQNYSSVEDVARLLKDLYKGKLLGKTYTQEFLSFMKLQERTNKIPRLIKEKYSEFKIANKTGEMAQIENDAALILSDNLNLIFVVMTDNIPLDKDQSPDENLKLKVQEDISQMGLMVIEKYKNENM